MKILITCLSLVIFFSFKMEICNAQMNSIFRIEGIDTTIHHYILKMKNKEENILLILKKSEVPLINQKFVLHQEVSLQIEHIPLFSMGNKKIIRIFLEGDEIWNCDIKTLACENIDLYQLYTDQILIFDPARILYQLRMQISG